MSQPSSSSIISVRLESSVNTNQTTPAASLSFSSSHQPILSRPSSTSLHRRNLYNFSLTPELKSHRSIAEQPQLPNPPKMSMRIVPSATNPDSFSHTNHTTSSAPSAPGVHDTLRHGVGPSAYDSISSSSSSSPSTSQQPVSAHPLEARLKNWEATQEALRMESLRRTFGIAEPVRRGMELKIVRQGEWRPMALGGGNGCGLPSLHEEILRGREDTITWEDVFTGEATRAVPGVHDEMERKLKIQ